MLAVRPVGAADHAGCAPPAVIVAVLVTLAAALGGGCAAASNPGPDPGAASGPNAVVVRVVDGDTVVVAVGGREESARLIGIDTPETKRPDTPVECFGPQASDRLSALLPPDTPVRLELDQEPRDRYGRLLVYLHRTGDGALVNQVMLREGLADALSIAPNTAFTEPFAAEVTAARAGGVGLWGACPGPHAAP